MIIELACAFPVGLPDIVVLSLDAKTRITQYAVHYGESSLDIVTVLPMLSMGG